MFFAICIILSFSSILVTPCLIASSVTHLYIAPVSIFTSPNSFDISFVIVPFPVPAGPSIATINDIFIPPLFLFSLAYK